MQLITILISARRFHKMIGDPCDGFCTTVSSNKLVCTIPKGILSDGTSSLYFDISVNGKDYINNFAILETFIPVTVLSMTSPLLSTTGGDPIDIYVINLPDSSSVIDCIFSYISMPSHHTLKEVTVASSRGQNHAVCVSPTLPHITEGFLDLHLEQNSHMIHGPVRLTVHTAPRVFEIQPSIVITGVTSSVFLSFSLPNRLSLMCIVDGKSSPIRMLSSRYGFCFVQLMRSGTFELFTSHRDAKSPSFPLTSIDGPTDIVLNSTAIISSASSYIRASSASCMIPKGSFCSSDNSDSRVIYGNSCSVTCVIEPTANLLQPALSQEIVKSINFRICLATLCDPPLLSRTIDVLSPAVIAAITPFSGTSLGGTTVTLIGRGFVNDGTIKVVFGDRMNGNNSVGVLSLSDTRAVCISPRGLPSSVKISMYRRGVAISTSMSTFEYVPLLTNIQANVSAVLSIGGTVVSLSMPRSSSALKPISKEIFLIYTLPYASQMLQFILLAYIFSSSIQYHEYQVVDLVLSWSLDIYLTVQLSRVLRQRWMQDLIL